MIQTLDEMISTPWRLVYEQLTKALDWTHLANFFLRRTADHLVSQLLADKVDDEHS